LISRFKGTSCMEAVECTR